MNLAPIQPGQMKRLNQLLTQLGLQEPADKQSLVSAYSMGRATSSKNLTEAECRALIQHLELIAAQMRPARDPQTEDPADRQRKKILSMAHEMRWWVTPGRIDMARVERWCQEKSFGKKRLNAFTLEELPRLVSQFKIVYEKQLADLAAGR